MKENKQLPLQTTPLSARTLKDEFIDQFEALILSGRFKPGDRVPSERELASLFSVSRPVIHEGLRTLETRGLVTIESRKGARINDFRREGSVEFLLSLLNFSGGKLSGRLFDGLLEMRLLMEAEIAGQAALRHSEPELEELRAIVREERSLRMPSAKRTAEIDYRFHLAVSLSSGNDIYPLLMNSFRRIYGIILETFYGDPDVIPRVFDLHDGLVKRIEAKDAQASRSAMREILTFGERELRRMLVKESDAGAWFPGGAP